MNFEEMKARKQKFVQGNFSNDKEKYSLGQIETKEGNSGCFYLIGGQYYPSITTVLGSVSKASLIEWQERLGLEEANRIKNSAATRGNVLHDLADDYLNNKKVYPYTLDPITKNSFLNLSKVLNDVSHIYMQEQTLYSNELKLAGRVDLIAHFRDSIAIIDFKTSSKYKKSEYITNYYLQAAGYAQMLKERFDISANVGVILICVDSSPTVNEYVINTNDYLPQLKQITENYHKELNNVK